MKKLFTSLFLICLMFAATAQIPVLDKSPLDISTFPADYAMAKTQGKSTSPLVARVIYSRPSKNDRVIFGDLLEYNKVWRFGANEATEIEFFRDVKISGTAVKKGRYTIYVIPKSDSWTVIINKEPDAWGSFKYDSSKDAARADVPVQRSAVPAEMFYIYFDKLANGFSMNAGWDDVKITLPIMF